jgi:MYXO-CTERM domain-containing protein
LCESACSGSCTGKANLECQVDCQSSQFVTCKEEVITECNEECETTGAAIFCDGQFLATGGDLQACANELDAEFSISIDVDIDIDVGEVGGDDDDDGDDDDLDLGDDTGLNCSVGGGSTSYGLGFAALFMLGFGATRIRRLRRR